MPQCNIAHTATFVTNKHVHFLEGKDAEMQIKDALILKAEKYIRTLHYVSTSLTLTILAVEFHLFSPEGQFSVPVKWV